MFTFLLLLLVGTALAQESGDSVPETFIDKLDKAAGDEVDVIDKTFDKDYGEEKWDEEDLSLNEEDERMEPEISEKAEDSECPNKGTCRYHVFRQPRPFGCAHRICRCRRGNLSSIHSCSANTGLANVLKRTCLNASFVWIGVIKRNRCVPYCNVDGSSLNYANWGCGQPKRGGTWCVAMNRYTGKWVSLNCNTRLPFVCTF
ncbi:hypothetical protein GDO81_022584 [Engystomops pustulosus]|uniref:C-type lectin domain-containing protein n=1 Tax=Engystomops pustulosus TaxID=76066 RepID=A0AAV6Z895_ENGPU|nr:hypothetical protein GDO81_022584 [Engystomops pustulosus]